MNYRRSVKVTNTNKRRLYVNVTETDKRYRLEFSTTSRRTRLVLQTWETGKWCTLFVRTCEPKDGATVGLTMLVTWLGSRYITQSLTLVVRKELCV